MTLDDGRIRDLLDRRDDRGVLSFYVGHTPDRAADPQPTAPLELRARTDQLRDRLTSSDPDLAAAVDARIAQLRPALDDLVDPHAHGRGRALFAGVADGWTETVSLQLPFADRVEHHEAAYVRPLVSAHDEGRAAGVVNVTRDRVRVLAWALGEAEELHAGEFEVEDDVVARSKQHPTSPGGAGANNAGRADRDRFEARLEENRQRTLRDLADLVAGHVTERGWDRVVVAGSPKLREEVAGLVEAADTSGVRVLVADDTYEDDAPHAVASRVWPLLRSVHRRREAELVEDAIERALGGHGGAVGLRGVSEALNEGRIRHLLYRDDLEVEGFRSSEGTLHARVEGPVAQSDEVTFEREPLYVERLVERALSTGAEVTPITDEAGDPLRAHEGVGALLRW